MALAHDDIWQKFDLLGEQTKPAGRLAVDLLDCLPDCLSDDSSVPDISDLLFDVGIDCEGMAGLDFSDAPLLLPSSPCEQKLGSRVLNLPFIDFETETLRHDCMWSGLCPSEEHKATQLKAKVKARVSAQRQEVQEAVRLPWALETPCTSDIESNMDTSDLDETLSDCEEVEKKVEAAADNTNPTYTDHCYSGPSLLLTPAQSGSEDEDSGLSTSTSCPTTPSTPTSTPTFALPSPTHRKCLKDRQTTIRTRPPRASPSILSKTPPAAKFKFHMKLTSTVGSLGQPRSLLRHSKDHRVAKTYYTKKKNHVVKPGFTPSRLETHQVRAETPTVRLQPNVYLYRPCLKSPWPLL